MNLSNLIIKMKSMYVYLKQINTSNKNWIDPKLTTKNLLIVKHDNFSLEIMLKYTIYYTSIQ